MIMHSYYTSELNFVTDVKRILYHCTEKKLITISQKLFITTLENAIKRGMPITWKTFSCLEPINALTVSEVTEANAT